MSLNARKIIIFLFGLYAITTLLLPQAIFNKLIFVLILALFFAKHQTINIRLSAPIVILSILLYGLIISFFNYSDHSLAISFILSATTLLLIYPITYFQIEFDKIVKLGGIFLAFADFIFILYAANSYSMTLPFGLNVLWPFFQKIIPENFFRMLIDYCEVAIGERGFFGNFNVMIHLGTIPFLFLPICLWFIELVQNKKYINVLLIAIAMFDVVCSTSRGLLLVTGVVILGLNIILNKNMGKKILIIVSVLIIGAFALLYLFQNTMFFSSSEISNSVKIGHITSAFSSMSILQMLFGKGLASYYFSAGTNYYIAHTEITLLDYFRYFGVILGSIVYLKLIFPLKALSVKNYKTIWKKGSMLIFIGYLFISLTNPVLMNTMGIIVVLWYWNDVYHQSSLGEKTC